MHVKWCVFLFCPQLRPGPGNCCCRCILVFFSPQTVAFFLLELGQKTNAAKMDRASANSTKLAGFGNLESPREANSDHFVHFLCGTVGGHVGGLREEDNT